MGLLCFTADQDHLAVPVDIFVTQAQQGIQTYACVIKHLEDAEPEPGRCDLATFMRTTFLAYKGYEPVACSLDGVSIDCLAGSLWWDNAGFLEWVDRGMGHQAVFYGVAPNSSMVI